LISEANPYASLAEDILRLEQTGPGTFRSEHRHDNSTGVIFGGQFLAQALLAASRTMSGWPAHSCSAYFLRPGRFDAPIDYQVESVRDGRSFANRRVVARQSDKVLFDMLCSLHPGVESGIRHQAVDNGGLPGPESLPDLRDYLRENSDRIPAQDVASYFQPLPIEFRLINPERTFHLHGKPEARRDFWMRFLPASSISDLSLHLPLIAFVSDFWLGPVANELHAPPYPARHPMVTVSHSVAFLGAARANDWLLYRVESPYAAGELGLTRGLLFDREGKLIASTSQEVLMRQSSQS
jgi:acyl-CoA thioesterase II